MKRPKKRLALKHGVAVVVAAGIVLVSHEVLARGQISGRLDLSYQENRSATFNQENFIQRYEATVRDRLFQDHALRASVYFDDNKLLRGDLTFRRYWGLLDLTHKFYRFSARVAPRQKITALQLDPSQETTENQFTLQVRAPRVPQLRLHYARRRQYEGGSFTGYNRDFRSDLRYIYKIFDLALNRWYTTSENGLERSSTVTGGRIQVFKTFGPSFYFRTGYDHRLTESNLGGEARRDVTNQTVTGLMGARYRRIVSGSLSLTSRHLKTEDLSVTKGRDDTIIFQADFFPTYPLRGNLSRNYLLSEQNGTRTLSDYITAQLVLTGNIRRETTGRVRLARRFVVASEQGVIPSNIFAVSSRSKLAEGVEGRIDLTVARRDELDPEAPGSRYNTSSLAEMFLRPTEYILIRPKMQFFKYSDSFGLLNNNRRLFALTGTYFVANTLNFGLSVRRNVLTTGAKRKDTSVTANMGVTLRGRASLNVSYGVDELELFGLESTSLQDPEERATTFNLQSQIWLARRSSLSLNYSRLDRDDTDLATSLSINYRQDF